MMPILGFIQSFAQFQKLGLKASNSLELLIRLRRINAQQCMNLIPKVAKIARKRLFTFLASLNAKKFEPRMLNPEFETINFYHMVTP